MNMANSRTIILRQQWRNAELAAINSGGQLRRHILNCQLPPSLLYRRFEHCKCYVDRKPVIHPVSTYIHPGTRWLTISTTKQTPSLRQFMVAASAAVHSSFGDASVVISPGGWRTVAVTGAERRLQHPSAHQHHVTTTTATVRTLVRVHSLHNN